MKCKIFFLLSVITLLALFSIEHYSVSENTKTYTEIEIDIVDEVEEEDEKKFHNHRFINHATVFNLDFCEDLKLQNLLYYGIYKPPRTTFS